MRKFSKLFSPNVYQQVNNDWLFLPVGSIEQHSSHLPLNVDSVLAECFCELLAIAKNGIIAPTIPYGARSLPASGGGASFPGTISIPGDTLIQMYSSLVKGFIANGVNKLFILNGHWENEAFLFEALDKLREDNKIPENVSLLCLSWWSVVQDSEMQEIFGSFKGWHAEHAAQAETALMLHFDRNTVQLDRTIDHHKTVPAGVYSLPLLQNMISESGSLGCSSNATSEMGEKLSKLVIKKLLHLIEQNEES